MNETETSIGKIISLQKIVDPRGNLTVAENMKEIPFHISRVYWTMMSHLAPSAVDMPINTAVKSLLLSVDRSPLRSTMDVKRSLIHSTDPTKDCLLTLIYGAHLMIFHQVQCALCWQKTSLMRMITSVITKILLTI